MTTAALAREVAESKTYVYSRCRILESAGRLESKLTSGETLFCIDDQEAVTRLNRLP